jgi:proteasome lid subunit RPN8/RPN11
MEYLTLKLSTAALGLIYEKDFSTSDVFESFIRMLVSSMVTVGFLKEKQLYWATITPGYEDRPPSDQAVVESGTEDEMLQGAGQGWLSLALGEEMPPDVPMRYFRVELHTTPPDIKIYRKEFPLGMVDYLSNRVKTSLAQAEVIRADETLQVELYIRSGDNPRFEREIIHALPEELSSLEIEVEVDTLEETFPEKPMPECACGQSGKGPVDEMVIFCKEDGLKRLSNFVHQTASRTQEIGGVLIGEVYRQLGTGRLHIEIEDFIPAEQTQADAVSLRFTHETWRRLRAEKEARYPTSKLIIGWYHTHPPMPVSEDRVETYSVRFFSREDMEFHRSAFSQAWQVALVMDAESDEKSFFRWAGEKLIESAYHLCA